MTKGGSDGLWSYRLEEMRRRLYLEGRREERGRERGREIRILESAWLEEKEKGFLFSIFKMSRG